MTAILGTFSDARAVKTRSVFQIVVEIPIEQADAALKALGGWPQPACERMVGIALAKEEREAPKREKRDWQSLTPTEQAGIRCGEEDFGAFLCTKVNHTIDEYGINIAAMVRDACGVSSRKNLNTDSAAAARWQDLEAQYQSWLTDRRYEQSRTR